MKALHKLNINTNKTNIVIFRTECHGHIKNFASFVFDDSNIINVVFECFYLGISFSNSSVFLNAMKYATAKAKLAISATVPLIEKLKHKSLNHIKKLFNSSIPSGLMYIIQDWGLRYVDESEKIL